MLYFLCKWRGRAHVSLKTCYSTFIRIFNVTAENVSLNYVTLPTFDHFFKPQKNGDFIWLSQIGMSKNTKQCISVHSKCLQKLRPFIENPSNNLKKKKKNQISVWEWFSHPQSGLQDLVKVEQPWLFGELTGCQASSQPSPPVTLITLASGLLGPFAKPQAPSGSSKVQEVQAIVTREPHSTLLLLMELLASKETTSCLWHSHSPCPDQHHLDFSHSSCTRSHSKN